MRILGVDPGSRLTGYGCIDQVDQHLKHVVHGTLRLASTHGKATVPLEDRLLSLHLGLSQAIHEFKPQIMVVEKVFFAKNALSALKLGQARGAILLTGKMHGLQIVEYSATEVKHAVVGHGQAEKEQVARMIQLFLGKQEFGTWDASDGLALAICHALRIRGMKTQHSISGTLSSLPHPMNRRTKKRFTLAESVGIVSPRKPQKNNT